MPPRLTRNQLEFAAVALLGSTTCVGIGMLAYSRLTTEKDGSERHRLTLRGTEIHDFLTGRPQSSPSGREDENRNSVIGHQAKGDKGDAITDSARKSFEK
mmetsp:Transcript_11656/g.16790  ORF Transcript_11656/g.16790 Transcript_11656/m.16790 type:complete len:100 (+) Transcript_11656:270-569(+)